MLSEPAGSAARDPFAEGSPGGGLAQTHDWVDIMRAQGLDGRRVGVRDDAGRVWCGSHIPIRHVAARSVARWRVAQIARYEGAPTLHLGDGDFQRLRLLVTGTPPGEVTGSPALLTWGSGDEPVTFAVA
jgi:hypothetical protein